MEVVALNTSKMEVVALIPPKWGVPPDTLQMEAVALDNPILRVSFGDAEATDAWEQRHDAGCGLL